MGGGLREILQLPESNGERNPGVAELAAAFRQSLALVNETLRQGIANVGLIDLRAIDQQRDTLYQAFQKLVDKVDSSNADKTKAAMQRLLAATANVQQAATDLVHSAARDQQRWRACEADFDNTLLAISQLEDQGHADAPKLRKLGDAIRGRANDRRYGEAADALGKLQPVVAKHDPTAAGAASGDDTAEWKPPTEAKKPTLRKGDESADGWVEYLQQQLTGFGYDVETTGVFDDATLKAVKAFQKDLGCKVDGVVGNQTWSAFEGGPLEKVGVNEQPDETGAEARWLIEAPDFSSYDADNDLLMLEVVSVGDEPINDFKATIRITPEGGKPKVLTRKLNEPVEQHGTGSGDVHVAILNGLAEPFGTGKHKIEAYLPAELGGDFWSGTFEVPGADTPGGGAGGGTGGGKKKPGGKKPGAGADKETANLKVLLLQDYEHEKPVEGAVISIMPGDRKSLVTDAKGTATFEDLPHGNYEASFVSPDGATHRKKKIQLIGDETWETAIDAPGVAYLLVTAKDTEGKPAAGVQVEVLGDSAGAQVKTTGSDGAVEFEIPREELDQHYQVSASKGDALWVAETLRKGKLEFDEWTEVELMQVDNEKSLVGVYVFEEATGLPIVEAEVFLKSELGRLTDDRGFADFGYVEPGSFAISVDAADYESGGAILKLTDPGESYSPIVNLKRKPTGKTGKLQLQVLDNDTGVPVFNATATVNGESKTTKADGSVEFDLDEGVYVFNVQVLEYEDNFVKTTIEAGKTNKKVVRLITDPTGGVIDDDDDGDPTTSTLTVSVVDNFEDENPLTGVKVSISPAEQEPITTDADGEAVFMDLPHGDYTIKLVDAAGVKRQKKIHLDFDHTWHTSPGAAEVAYLSLDVANHQDEAVEGVKVSVSQGSKVVQEATTDKEGSVFFEIPVALIGADLTVTAAPKNGLEWETEKLVKGDLELDGIYTILMNLVEKPGGGGKKPASGETADVAFRITDAATGGPIDILSVTIHDTGASKGVVNESEGTIAGVSVGEHEFEVLAEGYQPALGTIDVKADEGARLEIKLDPEISIGTGDVEYQVTDAETGKPVEILSVTIHDPAASKGVVNEPRGTIRSITRGKHEFEVLATGYEPLRGFVDVPVHDTVFLEIELTPLDADAASAAGSDEEDDFDMENDQAHIEVTVLDADGKPVDRAQVRVTSKSGDIELGHTDAKGVAKVGRVSRIEEAQTVEAVKGKTAWGPAAIKAGALALGKTHAVKLDKPSAATVGDLEVTVVRKGTKEKVRGCVVQINPFKVGGSFSSDNGVATIESIPPGDYEVVVIDIHAEDEPDPTRGKATIAADKTTSVTIEIP